MNWLAINAGPKHCFVRRNRPLDPEARQHTGSLVIELDTSVLDGHFVDLVDYRDPVGWSRRIRIRLALSGHLSADITDGAQSYGAELSLPHFDMPSSLRVTLAWDTLDGTGYLAAGLPGHDLWYDAAFTPTFAPYQADLLSLVTGDCSFARHPALSFSAVSSIAEPIGILPGLAEGTLIRTASGHARIEDICKGDLVMTAAHGLQPVRATVWRSLPAFGWCAPVLIPAPTLGLKRNLMVAPDHRVVVASPTTEYLFGLTDVLLPAQTMTGIVLCRAVTLSRTVHMHQLIFDRHEVIEANGALSESLYTGGYDRAGHHLRNTVLDPRRIGTIPIHDDLAEPVLANYEASVLVSEMCA